MTVISEAWAGMWLLQSFFQLILLLAPSFILLIVGDTLLKARYLGGPQRVEHDVFCLGEAHWVAGLLCPHNGRRKNFPHLLLPQLTWGTSK